MRATLTVLGAIALAATASAKEPGKKTRSTVPGPYPSIIQMQPMGDPRTQARPGIIQSELGGRELQFLQLANQAGNDQSALVELAKRQGGSEQIKAVAEALASTQVTESKEVARIAVEKHVALSTTVTKAINDELGPLTGAKFEKAWIERLMQVNESAVTAYELGAKLDDADIRSLAEKMLPVAQARLQMANRLGGRSVAPKPEQTPQPAANVSPAAPDATPRAIPPPIVPSKPPAQP